MRYLSPVASSINWLHEKTQPALIISFDDQLDEISQTLTHLILTKKLSYILYKYIDLVQFLGVKFRRSIPKGGSSAGAPYAPPPPLFEIL